MDWQPLPTIDFPDKTAANLRKQLADLEEFRAQVLSPKPPAAHFYAGDDAVNEALRRELVLRLDIADYLRRRGRDDSAEAAATAAVRKVLDEREGHRS
jgi:hypothetical protein